jgi:hypothetical protein
VCLAAHFHRLEGDDVENRAEGREEHVERRPQVLLLYLG